MRDTGVKCACLTAAALVTLTFFSVLASLISVRQLVPQVAVSGIRLSKPKQKQAMQQSSSVSESSEAFDAPKVAIKQHFRPTSRVERPSIALSAVEPVGTRRPTIGALSAQKSSGEISLEMVSGAELVALRTPAPRYPSIAQRRGLEGNVTIEIEIDGEGRVANAHVTQSTRPGVFEASALSAIRRWQFRPVVRDGKPARVRALQTVVFRLEK